jgi:hypothetical protein
MNDERAQMFQSFLSDQCRRCRKEPACAKMIDLQSRGKAQGVEVVGAGYQCREYARDLPGASGMERTRERDTWRR